MTSFPFEYVAFEKKNDSLYGMVPSKRFDLEMMKMMMIKLN